MCVCFLGCAILIAGITLNLGWNSLWKCCMSRIEKAEGTFEEPHGASICCSTNTRNYFLLITVQYA